MTLGGDLAAITNSDEHQALMALYPDADGWIGLNDVSEEGSSVWSDGSISPFTSWDFDQSDVHNRNKNCVSMHNTAGGVWKNLSCHALLGFFCEICGTGSCMQV
jgi:hypothetical protein